MPSHWTSRYTESHDIAKRSKKRLLVVKPFILMSYCFCYNLLTAPLDKGAILNMTWFSDDVELVIFFT